MKETFEFEIEFESPDAAIEVFGANGDQALELAGGSLTLASIEEETGFAEVVLGNVIFQFADDIIISLFASALYDALKRHVRRIRINGQTVPMDSSALEEALRFTPLARKS